MRATVKTSAGVVTGMTLAAISGRHYCAFLGIPYAKPPVGELRFKPPQPPESWSGVLSATKEASPAPQMDESTGRYVGDEDCLYLNVYVPEAPTESRSDQLPVMVWVHGGGFGSGSGGADVYGPDYLMEHQVLLVSINFRLGVLGFASTGDSVISGNMGLKDLVMALRWIQDNIGNFGGNPGNVTIFGGSSGSMSCHALVLSPMGKGLFHRAILQSGVITVLGIVSSDVAERTFLLSERLGMSSRNSSDVADFLMNVPAQKLVENMMQGLLKKDEGALWPFPFVPTVEPADVEGGAFFQQHPLEILRSGDYNRVPMLMGANDQEGILFLKMMDLFPKALQSMDADFSSLVPYDLPQTASNQERAKEIRRFYFQDRPINETTLQSYADFRSDTVFMFPSLRAAKLHSSQHCSPIYFYVFAVDAKLNFFKKFYKLNKPGASHGDEVSYIFLPKLRELGNMKATPDSVESKTVARMTKLWTNFAKIGNPTPSMDCTFDVTWPTFNPEEINYLKIGNEGLSVACGIYKERMDFWERLYVKSRTMDLS